MTPIESEFATTDEAEAHDAWVRAKVETALASNAPTIPHDQVMAEIQGIIDAKRSAAIRQARPSADHPLNKKGKWCLSLYSATVFGIAARRGWKAEAGG